MMCMGVEHMKKEAKAVDVICQHSRDGTTIPMKVRVMDDDGQLQSYAIKGFKDLSHSGSREMPDGMYVNNSTLVFECFISDFGRQRLIRLYREQNEEIWKMTVM